MGIGSMGEGGSTGYSSRGSTGGDEFEPKQSSVSRDALKSHPTLSTAGSVSPVYRNLQVNKHSYWEGTCETVIVAPTETP